MCYICDEAREAEAARLDAAKTTPVIEAKEVPTSRVLTRETVEKGKPCYEYSKRFEERFPVSVEVTAELAVTQAEDWNWDWAAATLLTCEGVAQWNRLNDKARGRYDDIVLPYQDALEAAWRKYNEAHAKAVNEGYALGLHSSSVYDRAKMLSEHLVEVERAAMAAVREVAGKRLREAQARAWAEIYITETDEDLFADRQDDRCACGDCLNDW
jgi:hypothetical protein